MTNKFPGAETRDRSFDILHLLAQFFQLRFHADDDLADGEKVRLVADRVRLAEHFLEQEVQRAADRFVLGELAEELVEMAAQARHFLGDVAAVGEENDLLEQPLVVGADLEARLPPRVPAASRDDAPSPFGASTLIVLTCFWIASVRLRQVRGERLAPPAGASSRIDRARP
jgi:hypothetical protein